MRASGKVQVGADRLELDWIGPAPGAAPTLVFLHDGLGSAGTWRDVPAALAAATGCGALVYSRAGYGGSTPRPGPWPVRFMHDEATVTLPRLLAALDVRDGFLVGHSDGASIALIYAADRGARAAAALGPGPGPGPGPGLSPNPGPAGGGDRAGAAAQPWEWRLRGVILEAPHVFVEPVCVDSIVAMAHGYRRGDLAQRMARRHGANADACFAAWVEVWLRPEFRAWTIEALLPWVSCPVLAMQGEQDEYGTLAQLAAVAARCGTAAAAAAPETLVLPDCGHTPHHQQREAALAAMVRFVERWL
jgi:pimeloyl-ACP methyl ester carboxylesterase